MRKRLERFATAGRPWRNWYARAGREIRSAAELRGWDPGHLADVLALVSPRCAVRRSVRVALAYLEAGELPAGVLGSVRRSVAAYEHGAHQWGPKVGAFRRALRGDHEAVTLDRWMAYAAQACPKAIRSGYVADPIKRAVCRVAEGRGWTPRQAQAAIWAGALLDAGRAPVWLPLLEEVRRGA